MSRQLINAAGLGLLSAVVSRGSVFVAMLVFAHKLTIASFGVLSLAYITATSFGLFIAAGISQSAGALIPRAKDGDLRDVAAKLRAYQWVAITLGIISVGIWYLASVVIRHDVAATPLVVASIFVLLSVGFAQSFQGILYATMRHREAAMGIVIGSALCLALLIGFRNHLTPTVGLTLIGSGSFATCMINWRTIRWSGAAKAELSKTIAQLRSIRKSLYPLLATASLGSPVHAFCVGILAATPAGMREVALYNASFQFYSVVTFIPSVIANIALPFFSKAVMTGGGKITLGADNMFRYALILIIAVAGIICGSVLLTSKVLLNLMLPVRFSDAGSTIQILVVAAGLTSISVLFQQKLNSGHFFWVNFIIALVYAIAYVIFARMFISLGLGSAGLALAILAAFALQLSLQMMARKFVMKKSISPSWGQQ